MTVPAWAEEPTLKAIVDSIMHYRKGHGGAFPTRIEIGREEWSKLCPYPNHWQDVGSFTYVYGVMVMLGSW